MKLFGAISGLRARLLPMNKLRLVATTERRDILRSAVHFNSGRVRITDYIEASANDVLHAVRQQGLEGLIGKRKESRYEPGKRSGAWIKTASIAARNW